jgi:hypothetical protein
VIDAADAVGEMQSSTKSLLEGYAHTEKRCRVDDLKKTVADSISARFGDTKSCLA